MIWLRRFACRVFGHSPCWASTNVPNFCITCKRKMIFNPGTEAWDLINE